MVAYKYLNCCPGRYLTPLLHVSTPPLVSITMYNVSVIGTWMVGGVMLVCVDPVDTSIVGLIEDLHDMMVALTCIILGHY